MFNLICFMPFEALNRMGISCSSVNDGGEEEFIFVVF